MTHKEFVQRIQEMGQVIAHHAASAITYGKVPEQDRDFFLGINAELVQFCFDLASEARMTGARNWEEFRDRRDCLTLANPKTEPSLN